MKTDSPPTCGHNFKSVDLETFEYYGNKKSKSSIVKQFAWLDLAPQPKTLLIYSDTRSTVIFSRELDIAWAESSDDHAMRISKRKSLKESSPFKALHLNSSDSESDGKGSATSSTSSVSRLLSRSHSLPKSLSLDKLALIETPKPKKVTIESPLLLESINQRTVISRSTEGKTSGTFFASNPFDGSTTAIKPVKEAEIFANELFRALNLPIPEFTIYNKSEINPLITASIDSALENCVLAPKNYKKVMCMEFVRGQSLKGMTIENLEAFFNDNNNLKTLGISMVVDLLIGNGDRTVYFTVKKPNPSNIMVTRNQICLIDQCLVERHLDLIQRAVDMLADARHQPENGNDKSLLNRYIKAIIHRSLGSSDPGKLNKITHGDEEAINRGIAVGIDEGVEILLNHQQTIFSMAEGAVIGASVKNNLTALSSTLVRAKTIEKVIP